MFGSIRDRISFSNVFSVICSTLIVTGLSASLLADQPAKKDSNARLQPKSAAWSTKVEPTTAKPGEKVKFTASVKLQPGWHLYKYTKQQPQSVSAFQLNLSFKTVTLIIFTVGRFLTIVSTGNIDPRNINILFVLHIPLMCLL